MNKKTVNKTLKVFIALHVSLAYLGMLTGFGMVLFSAGFFYFLINDLGLPIVLHALLTYLLGVVGPGAIILAIRFHQKIHRRA